ncbi:MAG: ATP-grasp domain-containing protein [Leptospira sp.]|nr:ATP-grasp domain-containing protein [Leptospira sp.]
MKPVEGCFLSIGAGKNQLPLIQAAKARGLHVISVDKNSEAPGFIESDIRILESTSEYRKILHAMSRVPYTHVLKGVGSRSFGQAVQSTAYLADKFKLTGNSPESIALFANKKKLKALLEKKGIPVPKSITPQVTSAKVKKKELSLPFPLIVKPYDGYAKKGIRIINDEKEWKVFSKGLKLDEWIIEPKIEGTEVTVLGFVVAKKFRIISISDKITTTEPPFIELAHLIPSQNLNMTGELKMICQSVVNITGLKNGPLVAEFKITKNGDCILMEAAPEVGGEFLADQLLKESYAYPYFQDLLSLLIGERPKPKFLLKEKTPGKMFAILFVLPKENEKSIKAHPQFNLQHGESFFMQNELLPVGTVLTNKEGNARRSYVYGISTTEKIPKQDWIQSLLYRANESS